MVARYEAFLKKQIQRIRLLLDVSWDKDVDSWLKRRNMEEEESRSKVYFLNIY
jgi:hypothetical protein